jgi:glycolate oxidase
MSEKRRFNPVTDEIISRLRKEIGDGNVYTDTDTILENASDETEDLVYRPEVVVQPEDAEGVSRVLRIAWQNDIPVTPRGGGTGLSGGALPVRGGIVLSMKKLNRIIEVDQDNFMAVVEPGVITQEFQEAVEETGLFFPPDPASRGSCFLGGNLAECSGGPRAVKYGVTKDYVTGIEAVLPDGTLIRHGGKLLKNVTGYNLTQTIIGSEGTLAVITKIIVRLLSLPQHRLTLMIPFPTLEDCARTVPAIMNAGIVPSALELMERDGIHMAEKHLSVSFPNNEAAAQLLVELDGNDMAVIETASEKLAEIALQQGASDVLLADSTTKQEELWNLRRSLGEAVKSVSVYKEEDTVVPRNNIVPLLIGVKEIAKKYGITTVCYGHAGDGNLHVNILKMDMSEEEWTQKLDPAIEEIFKHTVSLGGMISGEHGVGFVQRKYLPIAINDDELELMKRIKHAFDPKGILNPEKIFP